MKTEKLKSIASRAARNARRRKGTRQKAGAITKLHAAQTHGAKNYPIVKFKAGLDTAGWRVDEAKARHEIVIGDKFNEPVVASRREDEQELFQFACSLLRHECEHGKQTEIAPAELAPLLRAKGIPFGLWNLFEDARIEHCEREASGGQRFRWWRWTPCVENPDGPRALFWNLINREASSWSSLSVGQPQWTGLAAIRQRVRWYYTQAIRCATTRDLLPLLQSWVKEFPEPALPAIVLPRFSHDIGGETCPQAAAEMRAAQEAKEEPVNGCEGKQAEQMDHNPNIADGEVTPAEAGALSSYLREPDSRREPDSKLVAQTQQKLHGVITNAAKPPTRVATSGPRLHLPNAISGSASSFRGRKRGDGPRSITVIIDGSGSMSRVIMHAKAFLIALNRLDRAGLVSVRAWLSGPKGHVRLSGLGDAALAKFNTVGGNERLAGCMRDKKVVADMVATSLTVVYTDAELLGGNPDTNYLRGQGVDIVGGYVNPVLTCDQKRCMQKHFGRWFRGETPMHLATQLVAYLTQR